MRGKRFLRSVLYFATFFLVILVGLYCWTALFEDGSVNPQKKSLSSKQNIVTDKARLTTPKVDRIKTQGFARYIGASSKTIENVFGEPLEKLPSATNIQWWVYSLNEKYYFKVGIDLLTHKASSIFVSGKDGLQHEKLRINMPFKKLVQLSSLYANFKLNYHEQSFQLELSEDDLNERPLLSFKNSSYAITYLHPNSKKVYAIEYLDADMLLKKKMYRIVSKTPLPVQFQGETDWIAMNNMMPADLIRMINVKRSLAGTPALISNDELTQASQTILDELGENPKAFLTKEKSHIIKSMLSGNLNQKQGLYLYGQGIPKKLYKTVGLNRNSFNIYCVAPVYDNSDFFSDAVLLRLILPKLVSSSSTNIGIAYDRGMLVFIIDK
ncbi:CAP-associated domain-containing protein [Liquorilactobacillus uvarum]|uniref:CAP-associated domain-containing protein n=2 Tax=Liquorilactobacillus uvarum TaxID=303240 RepID=UPI00288B9B57|nr:CAP-associated domain-containing protein [Liquorilactobacillus uvarum]